MPTLKEIKKMPRMVAWFDPGVLLKIARPYIISGIFGTYADRRLVQAALDRSDPKELYARTDLRNSVAENDEIWFDFIADTGDGFDSTYTVAWLQAQPTLQLDSHPTKRGRLLLFGGDLVYPDATREDYDRKFKTPYSWALPDDGLDDSLQPRFFSIPGNHDWYDGLDLFTGYLCGSKPWKVGKWRANQKRSYFALQLTDQLWIWAVDIQLSEYVDQPQAEYFRTIASLMPESSSIVICTAVPGWYDPDGRGYGCLGYFSRIAVEANKNLRIPLVLSGDLHHYCRNKGEKSNTTFITSGGGGAFLHPTHNLVHKHGAYWMKRSDNFNLEALNKKSDVLDLACYPSMRTSRLLLFKNIFFPFLNWKLSLLLGSLTAIAGLTSLMFRDLTPIVPIATNPVWLLWVGAFGVLFFARSDESRWVVGGKIVCKWLPPRLRKLVLGSLHAVVQIAAFTALADIVHDKLSDNFGLAFWSWCYNLAFLGGVTLVGGLAATSIYAAYLLLTSLLIGTNANDSFSGLRLKNYKNFLRLRIKDGKLTVFPVGVKKVPKRSNWRPRLQGDVGSEVVPSKPIAAALIEDPIEIVI
jgi:hypothetical protein